MSLCYFRVKKIMAFEKVVALTEDLPWLDFTVLTYVHKCASSARIKFKIHKLLKWRGI